VSHAWNGADPTQIIDPGSYELGVEYVANSAVTISAIRVFEGASPVDFPSRRGRLWSTAGSLLGSAAMSTSLPSGWSEYTLDSPVDLTLGEHVVVSYSTGGNYAGTNHALDTAVVSADGLMTAVAAGGGVNGNGSFITAPGSFPDHASPQNTFYGIDLVYTATGGDTAPVIVGMSVDATGLTVTGLINATDAETLAGAVYAFDWGDSSTTSGSANTASHTYAAGGLYAVLGTVTDSSGLSTSAARPVDVVTPEPAVTELDVDAIVDQLASHAAASGVIDGPVNGHEPLSPPGNGVTCAVWFNTTKPAPGRSGLNATTIVVSCTVRLYKPLNSQPQDAIDPALTGAMKLLMNAYSGNFTLGGTVAEIDLLGQFGTPMWSQSAYQDIDGTKYRVISIFVAVVVNDVWQQVP
jgi:hypothetical protein